ncbi:MAG: hypothetical protein DME65_09715 [Verrucomicrobia bacterium]|nr:MAG: hypothetical protein DME65_09715 [Verrucomicrobiota bacterium]
MLERRRMVRRTLQRSTRPAAESEKILLFGKADVLPQPKSFAIFHQKIVEMFRASSRNAVSLSSERATKRFPHRSAHRQQRWFARWINH